ncbi:M23 family metallopeptidase [Leptospira gomenensis]|uniref:M23 family metallopeptidase n=1 Tax=Leptospira gomenensis TaxID=2484974 RepID=A0A5F1YE33_9LEPT|nr:M23 family metallopeptidase [Leptospira gomenensis]TGK34325.1 M23 family metallopeptidase [Leptospira gomenensis]TGK37313.1 M23 family metallopeptidase [Leptospira gomenensis]TGK51000.1 M23 family metallopeptidase [Leptospira gomenensis]TGK56622.1 M23 family metallopeptidase [Leptospira gomenensis]
MRKPILVLLFLFVTGLPADPSEFTGDCKPKEWVCVLTRNNGDKIEFFVHNRTPNGEYPFSLRLEFSSLDNLKSDRTVPLKLIAKGNTEPYPILSLSPIDSTKQLSYAYNYYLLPGDSDASDAKDVVYRLPYETAARVSQGYNGKFTHLGIVPYAVDFKMPEGTPVLAARDGLVIAAQDKFQTGGLNPSFKDKANFVQILHKDGSIAEYAHLKHKGVSVQYGQTVKAGDRIGLSGNTGYSSAPHLHFHVLKPAENFRTMESFPTVFQTDEGMLNELKEGTVYWNPSSSSPAGKIFFEEDFRICSELKNKKLNNCDSEFDSKKNPFLAFEIRKPGKHELKLEVCNPESVCKRIDWTLQPEWRSSFSYFDWRIFPEQTGRFRIQVIHDVEILKTWFVER